MTASPPRRAERLIRWSLAPWERPAILGDLNEEFNALSSGSELQARRWYWRQVLFSVWPNLLRRFRGDERRVETAKMGLFCLAYGMINLLASVFGTESRFPSRGSLWLLTGSLLLFDGLFRKRLIWRSKPRRPVTKRQQGLAIAVLLAVYAAIWFTAETFHLSEQQTTVGGAVIVLIAYAWPRSRKPIYGEFSVRHKLAPNLEREALLTLTVPNEPLGLSSVVLCGGAGHSSTGPQPLLSYEPTSDREFKSNQAVRVCAFVNLPGSAPEQPQVGTKPRAAVDVVNADGRVVKTVPAPIAIGVLEQMSESWSDFADVDRAEHFGQIDVRLPLSDLSPGSYRLRVRAAESGHASVREESLVVR